MKFFRSHTPKPGRIWPSQVFFLLVAPALNTASYVAAEAIWLQFAPVSPILNATDDFLLPFTLGSNKQTVYINPSLTQSDSFVMSPKACTPKGASSPKEKCIIYRGGAFDGPASASFTDEVKDFNYENGQYNIFGKGTLVKDNVVFDGKEGDWELDGYELGLVGSSNMTSGLLGLSKNSTFLKRLVDAGKIASRSFGLHVGIDIWNHPYPVLNPSFDESGLPPKSNDDFNSGAGKRSVPAGSVSKRQTDKLPVRESHKFPGSLTLGGYDKSKVSNRTKPVTFPIAEDGSLRLTLTNLILRNTWADSPFDLVDKKYDVILDSDTPLMWFPASFGQALGQYMGGYGGDDFFHDHDPKSAEDYLGNITMTFKSPDGKGDQIDIVVPPTVFFQPVGYMRNFELQGDDYYNYYVPIRTYRGEELPIRLGRSFLKAVYLFVNYDTNNFQLSQVAFYNKTSEIVSIAANQDPSSNDHGDTGGSEKQDGPQDGSGNSIGGESGGVPKVPIPILAGAAAGGAVLVGALIFLVMFLRKRRKAKLPVPLPGPARRSSDSDRPIGGRVELHSEDVNLVTLGSRPGTSGSNIKYSEGAVGHVNELPENWVPPPNMPPQYTYDSKSPVLGGNSPVPTYHEMPTIGVAVSAPHSINHPPNVYQQYPPPPGPPPVSPQGSYNPAVHQYPQPQTQTYGLNSGRTHYGHHPQVQNSGNPPSVFEMP